MRIKKALLSMGVVAGLAVGGVLGSVPAASASAPNHQDRTVLLSIDSGPGIPPLAFVPGAWHVGDCWLFQGTYVAQAGAQVHLHGMSGTEFTKHADVWHSTFRFLNSNGVTLISIATSAMDSPDMVPANGSSGPSTTYTWDRFVNLTPAQQQLWPTADRVVWSSSC